MPSAALSARESRLDHSIARAIAPTPFVLLREEIMPLIRIDVLQGRTEAEITSLLDAIHRAVVKAFDVPQTDRYQVLTEHRSCRLIAEDTGLGIVRTDKLTLVSVTTRPRSDESKRKFYSELTAELETSCGTGANDVIVSITTNSDSDWSFGNGAAQYLTGEL
jgi:phenylpyruvate tautomerase PptA (4-oxalocrotonate tautomerase family)